MAKKLQLHIPEACHESWDQMIPVGKGRFCASCQKQVVDFSNMSDNQIAQFFKKPSTGSVCGRFMHDQLDRDIEMQKKRLPWIKYFFQFAIPAFLITKQVQAQGAVVCTKKPETQKITGDTILQKKGEIVRNSLPIAIKVRLIDSVSGQPIPYGTINITGTTENILTNDFGTGDINIPQGTKIIKITASSAGYKAVTIDQALSADIIKNGIVIPLASEIMNLPEVVLVSYGSARVYGRLTSSRILTKTSVIDTIKKWFTIPKISTRIYPNPVKSGTSISIEFRKQQKGTWLFELLNASGQFINKKELWIDEEARVVDFEIPAVTGGVYFLRAFNKTSGKKFTEKIIVE